VTEEREHEEDFDPSEVPSDEDLEVEGPNESAPGHNPDEDLEDLDGDDV
jgi:hypothetical protein